MTGWVFFRANDLPQSLQYLRAMFSFSEGSPKSFEYYNMTFLTRQLLLVLIIGIMGSTPITALLNRLREKMEIHGSGRPWSPASFGWPVLTMVFIVFLYIASVMQVAITTYSPFIYAKF